MKMEIFHQSKVVAELLLKSSPGNRGVLSRFRSRGRGSAFCLNFMSACLVAAVGIFLSASGIRADEPENREEASEFVITKDEHVNNFNDRFEFLENRMLAMEGEMGNTQKSGNPVRASSQSIAAGEALYQQYCSKCHGDTGAGNGPLSRAIPNIADLTGPKIKNASDETIFHQITYGKPPMPSFQALSEKQRWDIVNYVRSLQSGNGENNY